MSDFETGDSMRPNSDFDFARPAGVLAYLKARGDCGPGPFRVSELSGGNLNRVWRVIDESNAKPGDPSESGESASSSESGPRRSRSGGLPARWILKHAPPFVARRPEIALDPGRLGFEARALAFVERELATSPDSETLLAVRSPRLFDYDSRNAVLFMQDFGDAPDLSRVCVGAPGEYVGLPGCDDAGEIDLSAYGATLGRWLARLHNIDEHAIDANQFRNRAVQAKRDQVQYQGARDYLLRAGVAEWEAQIAGDRAAELGRRLLEPGICLVMGDLWPASLLFTTKGPGLIDWEFAHFGRPAQDVAHLAAHLYMRTLIAEAAERESLKVFARAFLQAYRASAAASRLVSLEADAGAHFGCEILMRTAGPFQDGYVFEGRTPSDPAYRAAIQAAVNALQHSKNSPGAHWSLSRLFE